MRDDDHFRGSDLVIHELKKFVEEESLRTKEWQEKHERDSVTFRTEIMERIRPFEEFASSLNWFWRIALAISGLVWSLMKGWAWIKEHVK